MGRVLQDMSSLFAQLGQKNDLPSIRAFIDARTPIGDGILLHDAPFWSASQADFLREAILDDAEWASIVDALNSELHEPLLHPALLHSRFTRAAMNTTGAGRYTPHR